MSTIVITPESKNQTYWSDVYQFRQIIFILAWRDIKVRYKQSIIGIFWTLIKPTITIAIFWIVSTILDIGNEGVPKVLVVASAVVPWQYISSSFSDVSNSLINNEQIIRKIYFPLVIIPISSAIVSLFDFIISIMILITIYLYLGFTPNIQILFLPLFLLLGWIANFGIGLIFASSAVRYRDFRVIVPFIIQVATYVSPIIFTSQLVYNNNSLNQWIKIVYALNPFVFVIDSFRWCLVGIEINYFYYFISLVSALSLFVFGVVYFKKLEKYFAEFI